MIGKKVEIEIIDKRKYKEKQKKDIKTHYDMLKKLVGRLRREGLEISLDKKGEGKCLYYIISQLGNGELAEIYPFFLEENDTLSLIQINAYNKEVFDYIQETVKNYRNRYNHLQKNKICYRF